MVDSVNNYGVFLPETRANPQALYERMRTEVPVYSEITSDLGRRIWVLTRYDDCVWALKDPRIGKEARKHMPPHLLQEFPEPEGFERAIDRHMLNLDPPDHTRLRVLVHKAFTPHIVEALRPRIHEIENPLLDSVEYHNSMDIIADFGFPLPIIVISELLGIPAENRDQFRQWTKTLLFARSHEEYVNAAMEFVMYMSDMLVKRRANPQDDLLSNLVTVQEKEDKLDQQELLSMIFLLL